MNTRARKPVHLMARPKNAGRFYPFGNLDTPHLPRTGDLIEVEMEGEAQMLRVLAVVIPAHPSRCSAELWAVFVGQSSEVILSFLKANQ